jgi:glycosyltransferase involved in cell wall biosynthesis
MGEGRLRVLAVTNLWPRVDKPIQGVWTQRQLFSLTRHEVIVDVLPIAGREHALASLGVYARAAWEVLRLNLGRRRYDVVHAHTGHCGLLACLQVRYPVVMSYVGYDLDVQAENREGVRTKFERHVFRALSVFLAATIAKSRRGAQRLPARGRARNTVIPNGVDRERFAPVDRSATLMSAADLLLLTSVAEGSPNVVKEAMACDLPVVSVDVGDVREHLDGVRNCYVCSPDADRLADAIASVVAALPQRSDGRARSEHLGLDPIAERVCEVYRAALTRGPGLLGWRPVPSQRPARAMGRGVGSST